MRIKFRTLVLTFLTFSSILYSAQPRQAVTYDGGARFGDKLIAYLHAKWLSYKYQIPLLYKPFVYSSELALHVNEIQLTSALQRSHMIVSLQNTPIDLGSFKPFIYVCPYFPETRWELENFTFYHFEVDWKDQEFRNIVLKMIAPRTPLQLILPPENTVNIAIHIREGGGVDSKVFAYFFP